MIPALNAGIGPVQARFWHIIAYLQGYGRKLYEAPLETTSMDVQSKLQLNMLSNLTTTTQPAPSPSIAH